MKKGLCIILSALMVVLSFAACGKKKVSDEPTKIDENGSAYVEVTDKDGKEVTSVLSDKDKKNADKNAAKNNKNTTTANYSEIASQLEKQASGMENLNEKDLVSDKKDLISGGTEIKKTSLRDDIIGKTLKSGKFTLKMKMKAASGTDDGSVMKYYFSSKKEWKRMELISGDEVSIYDIESLSGKVDESVFSLAGYTDITALMSQMDTSTTTKKK